MKIHPNDLLLDEVCIAGSRMSERVLEHLAECLECRHRLELLRFGQTDSSGQERARAFQARRDSHPEILALLALPALPANIVLWPGAAGDYHATLKRNEKAIQYRIFAFKAEREAAPGLLSELLVQPLPRRTMLIRNVRRFHTWGLFELLLERSREESFQCPGVGEDLARLGLLLAEHLDVQYYGRERIEDFRARSWAYIANSRRIMSDFCGAEEAFETAYRHILKGTRDSMERAIYLDLKASLLRDQRRFDDALRLLNRTYGIFVQHGETHRAGRALVGMESVFFEAGMPEKGIPLLYEALELMDSDTADPRLLLCIWHNLMDDLAESGRFMEAQGVLAKAQPLYRRFCDFWSDTRFRWVRGKIARGLGQLVEAEALFVSVRDCFLKAGIAYDAALVSLDLAALYARQGRACELKRLAEEMVSIFSSLQIHREALTALLFLCQAAQAEALSLEMVTGVASYLRQARHQPELRFQLQG
ncbi:MAG: hypothetical protein M3O15_08470 [Acidobacteriota bacterium]|nr:hypothetical protein [Acidobacteriota bacterium]